MPHRQAAAASALKRGGAGASPLGASLLSCCLGEEWQPGGPLSTPFRGGGLVPARVTVNAQERPREHLRVREGVREGILLQGRLEQGPAPTPPYPHPHPAGSVPSPKHALPCPSASSALKLLVPGSPQGPRLPPRLSLAKETFQSHTPPPQECGWSSWHLQLAPATSGGPAFPKALLFGLLRVLEMPLWQQLQVALQKGSFSISGSEHDFCSTQQGGGARRRQAACRREEEARCRAAPVRTAPGKGRPCWGGVGVSSASAEPRASPDCRAALKGKAGGGSFSPHQTPLGCL